MSAGDDSSFLFPSGAYPDYPVFAGTGATSALKVKVQDGPELYVCRLLEGRTDFANLDLVLDEYTEFTVEGAALHITGAAALQSLLGWGNRGH